MQSCDVLKFIEEAEDLPTLPAVAARVVGLTAEGEASVKEVADLIEKDVALSAKILKVINSPFYGFSRGITNIPEAVGLMGFNQVGSLALGLTVIDQFLRDATYGLDYQSFWEHSVGNAVAAMLVTAQVNPGASHGIFTTALLQDIGMYILAEYVPYLYGYAVGVARERGIHRIHAEREVLKTDHAEVGAVLAERWNLPPSMYVPIRHHHFTQLGVGLDPKVRRDRLRATVYSVSIAALITEIFYQDVDAKRKALYFEVIETLAGLQEAQVTRILDRLPREMETVKTLFQLETLPPAEANPRVEPESLYYDVCPKCGSDVGTKFCGLCGTSLKRKLDTEEESRRARKIVIADDSAATRTALGTLLRRMGYTVLVALNGKEAVDLARAEQPDMILMDLLMPVMDGLEALRAIRSDVRLRSTPVVMLTSVTDLRLVTEAIESGANDYIAKPFSIEVLAERVQRYVHGRSR